MRNSIEKFPLLQKEGKCIRHIFNALYPIYVLNSLDILLYPTLRLTAIALCPVPLPP